MLKFVPQDAFNEFRDSINATGGNVYFEAIKILRFVHREAMMHSQPSGLEYQNETVVSGLANSALSHQERLRLIQKSIKEWEQRNGFPFGSECIYINEEKDNRQHLESYEVILKDLKKIVSKKNPLFNEFNFEVVIRETKEKLQQAVSLNESNDRNHLLKFDPKTHQPIWDLSTIPYFSRYIGYYIGILKPYLELNKCERKLSQLLSDILIFDHYYHNSLASKFSPVKLRSRIKGAPNLYGKLENRPFELGLINTEFIKYLFDHQGSL